MIYSRYQEETKGLFMKSSIGETLKKCRLNAGKSVKEISDLLHIKLSLVKYRVSRAKKLLAEYLGEGE